MVHSRSQTKNAHAGTAARLTVTVLRNHVFLPTSIIAGTGSTFNSQVLKKADFLGNILEYATNEHAETLRLEGLKEHMFF